MKRTTSKQKEKEKYTPPDEMTTKEFEVFRVRNLYHRAQDEALVGCPFWTKDQSLIYLDILKAKKNLFVTVKSIDVSRMEKDTAYFGEALALSHQWGLIPFIRYNKDYDPEIVAQFYATIHFHANERDL